MEGRVLVVDDDPILMMSLRLRLANAGYEVEEAVDGKEALEKLVHFEPDIILADIMMPRMDGYALHSQLRKDPETASIPFIFLSAKSDTSDQLEGLRMGADDYVCKPFEVSNLIERMKKVMERADAVKGYRARADFSGNLSQMSWADVIQIAELNHKSGELVFRNSENERMGSVFFREGQLVNARVGEVEGEEAFFTLMSEREGYFEFFGRTAEVPRAIESSNTAILLKGSRMADEYDVLRRKLPHLKVVFRPTGRQVSDHVEEKVGRERLEEFLRDIEKGLDAGSLIDSGRMSPVRAASILSTLMSEKIVEFIDPEAPGIRQISISTPYSMIEEGLVKVFGIIDRRGLTGILKFNKRLERQSVFFKNGRMVHCFHGKVTGKKAFFRVARERGGTLKFIQQPVAVLPTINSPLPKLLEEANREVARFKGIGREFFEKKVMVDEEKAREILAKKELQGLRKFIALVQQHGKVADIVDSSPLDDSKTVDQINYLTDIGLLRVEGKRIVPVQVVTDSTADIPPELVREKNIVVAPLSIHFGETVYKDGITVTPNSFYEMLKNSKVFPHTSPPSIGDFHQIFRQIVPDRDILCLFLSRKMSKTFENAMSVKEGNYDDYLRSRRRKHGSSEELNIEMLDSRGVSLALGLLVLEAAEKVERGWPLERIVDYIRVTRDKIRTYFVVDTLEYLRRGGRIGKAKALLGSLLQFKPILGIQSGEVAPVTNVRGGKNAQQRVIQMIRKGLENPTAPIKLGVVHADAEKQVRRLKDLLDMNFNCRKIVVSAIGPTVGTHCGPGTVAVTYFPVDEEDLD